MLVIHPLLFGSLISILLFSLVNLISISELLHDSDHSKLFELPSPAKPWPKWKSSTSSNSKTQIAPDLRRIFGEISTTAVEGSIITEEDSLKVPHFLNFGIQNAECLCSDPSPDAGTVGRICSTTCTTSETLCGRTCVRSTTYAAIFSLFSGVQWQWKSKVSVSVVMTSKYFQVTEHDCEKLESECIASSALVEASKLAGVAVALSAGIAVGAIAIGLAATSLKENEFNKSDAIESALKSSIAEQLEVPIFLREKRQITKTVCTCQVSIPLWGQQECSTTCLSSKQICGHFCIETSIFQAVVYLTSLTSVVTTRTFLTVDKSDCDKMEVDCIGSSAIVAAGKAGAVSAIVTGALSAAVVAGAAAFALAPTPVKTREHGNETEEYQQHITTYGKLIDNSKTKIYSRKRHRSPKYMPIGFFESLLSKLKSFLNVLGSRRYSNKSDNHSNAKSGLNNEHETINDVEMSTLLESSIIRSMGDSLNKRNFFNFGRQNSLSLCSCADPNPNLSLESAFYGRICSTTCTTTKTMCNGQICIGITTFTALFTRFLGYQTSYGTTNLVSVTVTKKFEQVDNKSCVILERNCIVYSALGKARKSGAIAAGAAVALLAGIGIGSIALAVAVEMKSKTQNLNLTQTEEFYSSPEIYYGRHKEQEGKRLTSNNEKFTQKRNAKHYKRTATAESNEYYKNFEKPDIESSINIQVSQSSFLLRQSAYTCVTDSGNCSTTCLSSQMLCGGYCTLTTIFDNCISIHFTTIEPIFTKPPPNHGNRSTSTLLTDNTQYRDFHVVNEKDCERLEASCIASSAVAAAGRAGEIASGLSGVLTAGMVIIAAVVSLNNDDNNNQQSDDNQIPVNNLPIPVTGLDFPNDGCDDSSVRFANGKCHPLLSRGPCNETNRWVTTDPISLQGKCSPRLCTDDRRVFVGRTGLCHDVNDPKECQGGRRLYATAYGDSICDCPLGQYPFPNSTQDDCVSLFTKGPCPDEQVVTISQGGRLFCGPAECSTVNSSASLQQLVPTEKEECYALGSQGFCANRSLVLGYDIFKRQLQCVNISSLNSSNRLPGVSDSKKQLNSSNKVQLKMDYENMLMKIRNKSQMRRRQDNGGGIFRFPGSSVAREINFLLQPCRTGARQGINNKCANPLVPDLSTSGPARQPVNPAFTCPRNGTFLQTGGQCVNDNRATSCGPSFQFNEATGQCRPRF